MKPIRTASIITVLVFALTFGLGFPLQAEGAKALKGTVSGVVVNEMNKPVANTAVYFYQRDWTNTDGFGMPDWRILVGKAVTSKSGRYTLSLPAGEYKVWFVPTNLETYAMEAYPDAPVIRLGDTVTVRYGKTTAGVSAILNTPGVIEGQLFDTAPGHLDNPLANIHVSLCIQDYSIKNAYLHTDTDENGWYRFTGVKPYVWELWFNSMATNTFENPYGDETFNNNPDYRDVFVSAFDPYTWLPAPGTVETIRDWWLETTYFVNITGRLVYYDEAISDYKPVAGMEVYAYYADNPWEPHEWGDEYQGATDSDGYFSIIGAPGAYNLFVLRVEGQGLYYSEFYDNADEDWAGIQTHSEMGKTADIGWWELTPVYEEL